MYREDFGKMIFSESFRDGRLFIQPDDAPVIEFVRTCINPKDKGIMSGRIWLEMKYYDKIICYGIKVKILSKHTMTLKNE